MDLKKKSLKDTSYRGLNNRISNFLDWLNANKPQLKHIDQLDKKTVNAFLNYMLGKTSPTNRNNFRTDLSSVFQILEDNELIERNFIKNITVLKSTPTRHKTYSKKQLNDIFSHLKKNDEILLLYIKFISYSFLRPIEINRLKIGDINIEEKIFPFEAKNSPLKTKIIPNILLKEIPDLSELNEDYYLFTPNKIGGEWSSSESNRRDYFSKRFKKVVKDHFKLGEEYGLYSFRHTYITILFKEYKKDLTSYEAKAKMLTATGHSSMSALEKYLRTIDADMPEDYSHLLI